MLVSCIPSLWGWRKFVNVIPAKRGLSCQLTKCSRTYLKHKYQAIWKGITKSRKFVYVRGMEMLLGQHLKYFNAGNWCSEAPSKALEDKPGNWAGDRHRRLIVSQLVTSADICCSFGGETGLVMVKSMDIRGWEPPTWSKRLGSRDLDSEAKTRRSCGQGGDVSSPSTETIRKFSARF